MALPEKIYEFVPTPEPAKWHHPECEGECIACLIERVVQEAYGSQGLGYLQRHLASPPAQQEPVAKKKHEPVAKKKHEPKIDLGKYAGTYGGYITPEPSEGYLEKAYRLANELRSHLSIAPAQRKPLTHEQRLEVLTRFKKYDMEWHGPAILIDLVEAAHGIGEKK